MAMPAFPTWIPKASWCRAASRRLRAPQPCPAGAPTQSARRRRAGARGAAESLMALAGGPGAGRAWTRRADGPGGRVRAPRAGGLDPAPAGVRPARPRRAARGPARGKAKRGDPMSHGDDSGLAPAARRIAGRRRGGMARLRGPTGRAWRKRPARPVRFPGHGQASRHGGAGLSGPDSAPGRLGGRVEGRPAAAPSPRSGARGRTAKRARAGDRGRLSTGRPRRL